MLVKIGSQLGLKASASVGILLCCTIDGDQGGQLVSCSWRFFLGHNLEVSWRAKCIGQIGTECAEGCVGFLLSVDVDSGGAIIIDVSRF